MGVFKDKVPNGPQRHMLEEMQRSGMVPILESQPSRYRICEACGGPIGIGRGWAGRWEGDEVVYRHAPLCPDEAEGDS